MHSMRAMINYILTPSGENMVIINAPFTFWFGFMGLANDHAMHACMLTVN